MAQPGAQTSLNLAKPEIAIPPLPGVPIGLPNTTVRVWSIMVIVPIRLAVPVFAPAEKRNEPGPVPVAPAVIVIHGALETADHAQPLCVNTLAPLVPPPAGMAIVSVDKR